MSDCMIMVEPTSPGIMIVEKAVPAGATKPVAPLDVIVGRT
jgi:hypothetical protein